MQISAASAISIIRMAANFTNSNEFNVPYPPPLLSIIRPEDIWIGDLLFLRQNRSLKYTENGDLLILMEMAPEWADLRLRLVNSIGWLCIHFDSILLNFFLLLLSFRKTKQQAHHKKIQFLFGNLAICNIILTVGFFTYTFLLDVWYGDVDSFDTLLALNGDPGGTHLWHFSKFLIHTELVGQCFFAQQFILLFAAADRYLTLFECYSPHAKHKFPLIAICILPYLLAFFALDRNLLVMWIPSKNLTNILRLLALLCPLLLSLVFCVCSAIGLIQQHKMLRRIYGNTLFRDELSISLSLIAIISIDSLAKFGIFVELLGANFSIRLRVRNSAEDAQIDTFLGELFWLAHFLLLLSSLLHALICIFGINFYRRRLFRVLRLFHCCRRRPTVDYSCETMRSILAQQMRIRQMRRGADYSCREGEMRTKRKIGISGIIGQNGRNLNGGMGMKKKNGRDGGKKIGNDNGQQLGNG